MKITLIGAGSVVFAKNLLGDILQFPELSDATLCLMDVDPARLKIAELMASKMVAALGVKAKIIATLDQRAAIRGARYVICTVQVGGYKPGTVIDFEIPRKYGLLQTIGDTLGVGGVFRGLRTIPVMTAIARDIAEVGAPDCLLLNYSNPMAMNCAAIAKSTGIPHVGLCHSVQGTSQQLAGYLGLPYEDITYLVAGINHMAFFLKFEYRGQDAYPLLFDLLKRPQFKHDRVRFEMMRRTGYFVTESSEHQSEYVPYFIHHGREMQEKFEVPIDEYLRRCEAGMASWKKTQATLLGENGAMIVGPQTHEYGSFIIHSRETNTPRVIYGNVPNTDLIDNLPREACVEVPCLVNAQGVQPTHIGTLPPQLAALCQTNVNVQTLTVEAALTNKREHIYHAVMLDPHTATVLTLDRMWAMCDELIAAHQKHGLLGEFAPSIPGTGRAFAGTGDRVLAGVEADAEKSGETIKAELTVANPRPKAFTARLGVMCVALDGASLGESKTVTVRVPAGKSVRKSVMLRRPDADEFVLRLTSDSRDVLVRDFIMRKRRALPTNQPGGAPLALKLAGFPAAEGTVSLRHSAKGKKAPSLLLRLAVDDSKIFPAENPWDGSSVELFFADTHDGDIQQFFLVPDKAARRASFLDRGLKRVAGVTARVHPARSGAGYEIEAEIPLTALGFARSDAFLFDLIVNVTALGDAHGGGSTSLSGDLDSHGNSRHFHRIVL
jgi:alpha-galactosidase/6-phospho-beta-glucosidase family protein